MSIRHIYETMIITEQYYVHMKNITETKQTITLVKTGGFDIVVKINNAKLHLI